MAQSTTLPPAAIPALVVLREQRAALQALTTGAARTDRRNARCLSAADRSRLMVLAFRVLAEAAERAEAECLEILEAAAVSAVEIVAQAQDDAARLADWLAASVTEPPGRPARLDFSVPRAVDSPVAAPATSPSTTSPSATSPSTTSPSTTSPSTTAASAQGADVSAAAAYPGEPEDVAGAAFFDSFDLDETGRWDFMEDDNLVGAGPLVRRLLRRPSGARPVPESQP